MPVSRSIEATQRIAAHRAPHTQVQLDTCAHINGRSCHVENTRPSSQCDTFRAFLPQLFLLTQNKHRRQVNLFLSQPRKKGLSTQRVMSRLDANFAAHTQTVKSQASGDCPFKTVALEKSVWTDQQTQQHTRDARAHGHAHTRTHTPTHTHARARHSRSGHQSLYEYIPHFHAAPAPPISRTHGVSYLPQISPLDPFCSSVDTSDTLTFLISLSFLLTLFPLIRYPYRQISRGVPMSTSLSTCYCETHFRIGFLGK